VLEKKKLTTEDPKRKLTVVGANSETGGGNGS